MTKTHTLPPQSFFLCVCVCVYVCVCVSRSLSLSLSVCLSLFVSVCLCLSLSLSLSLSLPSLFACLSRHFPVSARYCAMKSITIHLSMSHSLVVLSSLFFFFHFLFLLFLCGQSLLLVLTPPPFKKKAHSDTMAEEYLNAQLAVAQGDAEDTWKEIQTLHTRRFATVDKCWQLFIFFSLVIVVAVETTQIVNGCCDVGSLQALAPAVCESGRGCKQQPGCLGRPPQTPR